MKDKRGEEEGKELIQEGVAHVDYEGKTSLDSKGQSLSTIMLEREGLVSNLTRANIMHFPGVISINYYTQI